MKISHVCLLASFTLASILACHASASEPVPDPAADEVARVQAAAPEDGLPRVPGALLERLRELEEKDPAAFQDLLRRNLAARLLWQERGVPSAADLPVELAADFTPDHR